MMEGSRPGIAKREGAGCGSGSGGARGYGDKRQGARGRSVRGRVRGWRAWARAARCQQEDTRVEQGKRAIGA